MIGYVFLAIGSAGTAAVAYCVAPTGRGLHRYVVPRSQLRAQIVFCDNENDELVCKLIGLAAEVDGAYEELREALTGKEKAEQQVADLEEQLKAFDALCAENTELRARLANATAVRQMLPGPSPADDASALPDELQDFVDQTASAWRATA
ncbi:hypothetical protein [Streptomyces cylindrosporus]|uniref:Uncharacterized protein n=1 Tax=Streptomyces cylindrosporus TaxID=2927583 RepID=A0ABS9YJQ7_9ACTN|nr:hypothetical protein [Streptomyces cylindrosporus]MCI3277476.1 hypothetical protein [Streptomyces cylindrosporus]